MSVLALPSHGWRTLKRSYRTSFLLLVGLDLRVAREMLSAVSFGRKPGVASLTELVACENLCRFSLHFFCDFRTAHRD